MDKKTLDMGLWESIRDYFYRRRLRSEEAKRPQVARRSVRFDEARRIGILFNASDKDQERLVMKYVERLRANKNSKRKVTLLGFLNQKERPKVTLFKTYCLKDLDWLGVPGNEESRYFMQQDFDVAINFIDAPGRHADYLMALSRAQMRVGRNSQNTEAYDLIINDQQGGLAHFVGLLDRYLQTFNSRQVAAS